MKSIMVTWFSGVQCIKYIIIASLYALTFLRAACLLL